MAGASGPNHSMMISTTVDSKWFMRRLQPHDPAIPTPGVDSNRNSRIVVSDKRLRFPWVRMVVPFGQDIELNIDSRTFQEARVLYPSGKTRVNKKESALACAARRITLPQG